jgi:hypothetical protein
MRDFKLLSHHKLNGENTGLLIKQDCRHFERQTIVGLIEQPCCVVVVVPLKWTTGIRLKQSTR